MAETTKISWCSSTFNPVRGCSEVSPGCDHCYAREMAKRNPAVLGVWGPAGTRVVAAERQWEEPPKWDRQAKAAGERRRVFCASLADVFEDWTGPMVDAKGQVLRYCPFTGFWGAFTKVEPADQPLYPVTMDQIRGRLFTLIQATPNLDWLLLTKRPENVEPMLRRIIDTVEGRPTNLWSILPTLKNVWIGTTVENQEQAEKRLPILCRIPAAVRFVSAEPLLESVSFDGYESGVCMECLGGGETYGHYFAEDGCGRCESCGGKGTDEDNLGIGWIIVGGESGSNARPFNVDWARGIVKYRNAPVFVKQIGAKPFSDPTMGMKCDDETRIKVRDSHGADPSEWPEDLRVRELPEVVLA